MVLAWNPQCELLQKLTSIFKEMEQDTFFHKNHNRLVIDSYKKGGVATPYIAYKLVSILRCAHTPLMPKEFAGGNARSSLSFG